MRSTGRKDEALLPAPKKVGASTPGVLGDLEKNQNNFLLWRAVGGSGPTPLAS